MNGRIYDPKLGRFLQADPFVQDAKNSQSLNRYTYVYNNPLSYTDPSGYFVSGFLRGLFRSVGGNSFLRIVTSAVACFYGGPIGCGSATAAFSYGDGNSLFKSLKNGIIAGVSAQAMQSIGAAPSLSSGERILYAGAAGGISAELTGGNFGHGFLSAGIGFAVGLRTGGDPSPGKFVMTMIAGGTISEITGGKFANGAISAAMSYAMSSAAQAGQKVPEFDLTTQNGREQYATWVWENREMFGITVADGTQFEYVDEYMMYDVKLGRVLCDGPCTQIDNVGRFEMGGEYLKNAGKIVLYRGAFSPMESAVIMGSESNPTIIGNLSMSPAGSLIWAMGHEAAHTLGVDIGAEVYPHLNAERYGYQAYRRYKELRSE